MSRARTRRTGPLCVLAIAACLLGGVTETANPTAPPAVAKPRAVPTSAAPTPPEVTIPPAAPAPRDLPVITYLHVPAGFPADPGQHSTAAVTEAVHPPHKLALYDRPGGNPRAYLPREIRGVPVTVPIVARRPGWAAVLLPSVNRRIGWLPARGWTPQLLHDHVVVRVGVRKLEWLRDGVRHGTWTVAVGTERTPTPLGRTFVLGRTGTRGSHYGGVDALVLGAVPDDRDAVAPGLRDAHTGIHAWYNPSAFGRNVSNGCVRMPRAAQEILLHNLTPGTLVTVLS
jgi:L,D-transpeptidase-like protein